MASLEDDDAQLGGGWSCAMCTFENDVGAARCAICLTPRRSPPPLGNTNTSKSTTTTSSSRSPNPAKKPRSSTSPGLQAQQQKHKIQKPLVAVGSSNEQEALRLQKKIAQLRELGIDLPANDVIALLARNCYSVPAAVSAYFEGLATGNAAPTARDAETERRVAAARAHFESSFAREPFRLLGSKVMSATLNRSAVLLAVGDRLVLQAENAGKKRLRPGSAGVGSAVTTTTTASSLSAGIIRVATAHNSLVRRSARVRHHSCDADLCVSTINDDAGRASRPRDGDDLPTVDEGRADPARRRVPLRADVVADVRVVRGERRVALLLSLVCLSYIHGMVTHTCLCLQVLVFVYVHVKAFTIFHEEHPQFHLSDALYSALEMMHTESVEAAAGAADASDANALSPSTEDKDAGLEALFSDVIGSGVDEDDASHAADAILAEQLAPYLKDITLRDHQRIAVRWMLARENQVAVGSSKSNNGAANASSSVVEEINPVRPRIGCGLVHEEVTLTLHSLFRAPDASKLRRCGRRARSSTARARTS